LGFIGSILRPGFCKVGDSVYFNIIIEQSGKQKAKIARLNGPDTLETTMNNSTIMTGYRPKPGNRTYRQLPVRRLKSTIITICIGAGVVLFIFSQRNSKQETLSVDNAKNMQHTDETPEFNCEGKVYCSEMTSYEEAFFYLRHCPETQIDGDGDGVPCENQFGR
jgi:hypothetical protein